MKQPLKLMCILAHPDDESMGTGGILARYAGEGVATYLVTATRGQRGWFGPEADYPGPEALGRIREAELCAAVNVLGLQDIAILNYMDGELDQAPPAQIIGKLVKIIRQKRPHVVVTFDPNGSYGHPDHIAISQFTAAAIVAAASPVYPAAREWAPHQVAKLYYLVETYENMRVYEEAFGELIMEVDGQPRSTVGWEPWAITTRVNTTAYRKQVWQAIACHRSQLPSFESLAQLDNRFHQKLWQNQAFYRVFSLVNGGRQVEDDLFAGLR